MRVKAAVLIITLLAAFFPQSVYAAGEHPVSNTIYNAMLEYAKRDIMRESYDDKKTAVRRFCRTPVIRFTRLITQTMPEGQGV